ncbi:hypothetical protein [Ornithinibacillus halophilus]|uniref:Uncharacterized protein n=1 Tax=Ornithinibacillus halophilus TaxID=930117 RepID=A0A1M5M6S1_9BACI|nr:hypothetical protein [Ornithinibacillus halophilus]SHG72629.1 hypothetical protein SAMN05216225_105412 [Ornithinibacillus halophilus]
MSNHYSGEIFSGEFDANSFYLTQVKNLTTSSTLSRNQLHRLFHYLEEHNDTFTMTVNDQLPVLLQHEDISTLLKELEEIMRELKH